MDKNLKRSNDCENLISFQIRRKVAEYISSMYRNLKNTRKDQRKLDERIGILFNESSEKEWGSYPVQSHVYIAELNDKAISLEKISNLQERYGGLSFNEAVNKICQDSNKNR